VLGEEVKIILPEIGELDTNSQRSKTWKRDKIDPCTTVGGPRRDEEGRFDE
jgi:hypothetical protein